MLIDPAGIPVSSQFKDIKQSMERRELRVRFPVAAPRILLAGLGSYAKRVSLHYFRLLGRTRHRETDARFDVWSLSKQIFAVAWPLIISALLQRAYSLVDAFWVGRLGPAAINAANAAMQLNTIVLFIGFAFANGFVVPASGASAIGDKAKVARLLSASIASILIFSIPAVLVLCLGARTLIPWMTPDASLSSSVEHFGDGGGRTFLPQPRVLGAGS